MVWIGSRMGIMKQVRVIGCIIGCSVGSLGAFFDMYYVHKAYAEGHYDAARDACARIAIDNPDDWRALYNLGTFALQDKQYADALLHFDKVLALQPDNTLASERRALAQRLYDEEQQKKQQQQESDQSSQNSHDDEGRRQNKQQQQQSGEDAQQNNATPDQEHKDAVGAQNGASASNPDTHDTQEEPQESRDHANGTAGEPRADQAPSNGGNTAGDAQMRADVARAAYEAATASGHEGLTGREKRLVEIIEGSDEQAQRHLLLKAYQKNQGESHARIQKW